VVVKTSTGNLESAHWARNQQYENDILYSLRSLGDIGVDIPWGRLEMVDGEPYEVQQFLAGETLNDIYMSGRAIARQREAARAIARFLAALHSLPSPEGGYEEHPWHVLKKYMPKPGALAVLPREYQFAMSALGLELAGDDGIRAKRVLSHGDISGVNLIHNPDTGRLGVIDFGSSGMKTPYLDFSCLFRMTWPLKTESEAVVREYNSIMGSRGVSASKAARYGVLRQFYFMFSEDGRGRAKDEAQLGRDVAQFIKYFDKYRTKWAQPCVRKELLPALTR
jgi:hypothetical protein